VIRIDEAAVRVVGDLAQAGHRCALVGGLAVSVRAAPRTTRDIDFAVAVSSDPEAESLILSFRRKGYQLYDVLEQVAVGRLATARFRIAPGSPGERAVDLMFASSGIEPEIVQSAEELQLVPGSWLPVARRGHLLALKVLSHEDVQRPQDRLDIMALLGKAGEQDLRLAHEAVARITARGFNRGKDLGGELDRFIALARDVRR
jgi:hypothetical protein